MVDLEQYRSFCSLSRSDRIEGRLSKRFLPRFDRIVSLDATLLRGQTDVTETWREELGSTVRAISWTVVDGVRMVLVLLDDEDFGREMKWFFRAGCDVDYKHLVMAAEACTEILSGESMTLDEEPSAVDVRDLGERIVRSSMFCFGFPAEAILPASMRPLPAWEVARGVHAHTRGEGRELSVILETRAGVSEPMLLLLKSQLELLLAGVAP
jgi:hypothetical protein